MTIRRSPVSHTIADSSDQIRNQVEVIVQRDDSAFISQRRDAVVAGLNDVRHIVNAARQNGGHDGGITITCTPVDVKVDASLGFDSGEIVAAVKFGRILVVVDAQHGHGQSAIHIEIFALCNFDIFPPIGFQIRCADLFRKSGRDGQEHCQSKCQSQELFHNKFLLQYLFSQTPDGIDRQSKSGKNMVDYPLTEPSITPDTKKR